MESFAKDGLRTLMFAMKEFKQGIDIQNISI